MNDIQVSKYLGLFSLGLGALELLASRRIASTLGIASHELVQGLGVREVTTGLMVLNKPDTSAPMWGRVAGDVVDAAVLAIGLPRGSRRRGAAAAALLFVLGTAALDVSVAAALGRREQRALQTADRTRVRTTMRA